MSSPPSALTHPHTSHYLLSALRPRPPPSPAPPQHVTSPLSRTLALNPDDASASSSASLLSSSPRPTFARRASTTPGGASAGSAGLREGLLAQVVGCLGEEDEGEEKLKVLLGEELSWEHKGLVPDSVLDGHVLQLMHKFRDDLNDVPFLPGQPTTPRRPSSSASSNVRSTVTPTLSKAIPFRPLTPLSSHSALPYPSSSLPAQSGFFLPMAPNSPKGSNGNGTSVLSKSFTSTSGPLITTTETTAVATTTASSVNSSLPSSPLPVTSLSASAAEFKPSPRSTSSLPVTIAPSSLSSDHDHRPHSSLASNPALLSSPHYASSPQGYARIDIDDDDFSPFGTSLPTDHQPDDFAWPNASSSAGSDDWLDQEASAALAEAEAEGGPGWEGDMQMTPMDLLASIFTTLTRHQLETSLHQHGYDLDSTIQSLMLSSSSVPPSSQLSAASPLFISEARRPIAIVAPPPAGPPMPKPFVPKEGYVVAGGRASGLMTASGAAAGGATGASATANPFGGRVCRYYLQGECRRADCRFSHDIERALCRFWLRGLCAKGDSCDFVHTLPSSFDPLALSTAISNIELSESSATSSPPRPETPPPPVEDFPELGGGGMGGGTGSKKGGGTFKVEPGRTRFSSAVKKAAPAAPQLSSSSSIFTPSGGSPSTINSTTKKPIPTAPSSSLTNPSNGLPTGLFPSRPSTRLPLRPPTLLPTLATGRSLNALYLKHREKSIELGKARNVALARAAECWKRGDGSGAKKWSGEGRDLNEKMEKEGEEGAGKLVAARQDLIRQAVMARANSSDPADRARRGKPCGGGLGVILGVSRGVAGRSEGEREEACIDLHGLHGPEGVQVLERFLVNLESDHFQGLAYAVVGQETHTGTQDVGRGASKIRLGATVKSWLGEWGYPWSERDGVICVDPLTHYDA